MTALPIDAADWSKGPSIGSGLLLDQAAITVPTTGQVSLGPYYVATAQTLVLATTIGRQLASKTVAWAVLWLDGNGFSDQNGFVSTWNQSTTLGSFLVAFPVLGPYAAIVASTSDTTAVPAGVSAWKVGPGGQVSTMFGPQLLCAWDVTPGANTVDFVSMNNYIPGPATLTSLIVTSGGVLRLNDTNGLINPAAFLQVGSTAANQLLCTSFTCPTFDFQVELGSASSPSSNYVGSIISST